jgi:hypothetical protein
MSKQGRKALESMVVLTCWMIWLQQNARTFNRQLLTVPELTNKILEEVDTWISAGVHSLVLLG